MHKVRVSAFQLLNCVCYVVLISGGLGNTAWGVLASYLPQTPESQQDKTVQVDDSSVEKGFIGSNDILKSLSKLHMLAIGEATDASSDPSSGLVLPVYEQEQEEPADLVDDIAGDESPDEMKRFSPYAFQGSRGKKMMTSIEDKKAHASLGFVGSRGKRQPASLGFVGSRGKKQLNFIPSRGRKQMSTAFVGSRGRRISAEAFAPSRGRRLSSQAFFGSRGKKYSALGFMGSRGKKDSDFENLLLKNEDGWTQDNYNRRAAPFFHGFVASRGKRSAETNSA